MHERDIIFREQLVALVSDLNGGESKQPGLRRTIGIFALRLAREAGARDWADLKERADGATYDSALKLFQTQSQAAQKAGKSVDVRAFEVLGLSLIARRQYQADLQTGVAYLDDFIAKCERSTRKRGTLIPLARVRQ